MLRAAMYPRVSTDMQRGNYSIPSQVKDMMKHAEIRNYTLVGDRYVNIEDGQDSEKRDGAVPAFVDDYTSTELSRPGLNACLLFLKNVGFDVFLVHTIDRLARDPYFRQTIEREVAALGARVEYVLGNYDESPEGEVRKDLDSTFAKWENAKRVERSNRGKKRKAEMGKFVAGKPPYGYRVDPDSFGGITPYEPEAQVVQLIFKWFVEHGLSIHQIVRELSKNGIKTQKNCDNWATATLSKMLRSTVYAGYVYYNKHKRHGRRQVKRDKSEWIKIECAPIVPKEVFDAAQEIIKYNRESLRKQPKRFYLLSGMVVCSECQRPYFTQTITRRVNQYRQQGYRHRINQGHCCNRWITTRKLDQMVWDKVVEILLDPSSLRKGYERMMAKEIEKQSRNIKHLEVLETAIGKLQAKRARLQAIYLDPDIGMTKEEYLSEKKTIDEQISSAEEDIQKITKDLQKVPTERDLVTLEEMAGKIVEKLGANLDIPPEGRRKIMELLNLKVIISPTKDIKIDGWFTPESDGLLSTSRLWRFRL